MNFHKYYKRNVYVPYEQHYLNYEMLVGSSDIDETAHSEMERVFKFVSERKEELAVWAKALEKELLMRINALDGGTDAEDDGLSYTNLKDILANPSRGYKKQLKRELRLFNKKLDLLRENVAILTKFIKVNIVGFKIALKQRNVYRTYRGRLAGYRRSVADVDRVMYAVSRLILRYRKRSASVIGLVSKSEGKKSKPSNSAFVRRTAKYWVHPDNIDDLKACILRHLPVYIFNPNDENYDSWTKEHDSAITSIYYDNASFEAYNTRLHKLQGSEAIRIRWYKLDEPKVVFVERKRHEDGWTGYQSKKLRFKIPVEHVNAYVNGQNVWKHVEPLNENKLSTLNLYNEIQHSIVYKKLRPSVRTFYRRMAFQMPESNNIRLSLDTDLVMIKENVGDSSAPFNWRREGINWPFDNLRPDEICRFPYGILEVKTQDDQKIWINEYEHLIEHVHKFSKFMHGTAVLYNTEMIPYWLPQMSIGIQKESFKSPPRKRYEFRDGELVEIPLIDQQDGDRERKAELSVRSGNDRSIRLDNDRDVRPGHDRNMRLDNDHMGVGPDNDRMGVGLDNDHMGVGLDNDHMGVGPDNDRIGVRRTNEVDRASLRYNANNINHTGVGRTGHSNTRTRSADINNINERLINNEITVKPSQASLRHINDEITDGQSISRISVVRSDEYSQENRQTAGVSSSNCMHCVPSVSYAPVRSNRTINEDMQVPERITYGECVHEQMGLTRTEGSCVAGGSESMLGDSHRNTSGESLHRSVGLKVPSRHGSAGRNTSTERDQPVYSGHGSAGRNTSTEREQPVYTQRSTDKYQRAPKHMVSAQREDDESTKSVLVPIDNKRIAIPVRVEPKVFFANERTFLSWLHFSIFIGGLGSAMVGLGDYKALISGAVFIVVSTIFAVYALYLYMWRAHKIRARNPGPYDDLIGPGVLVFVFIAAMALSLLFKMPLH
ncbi:putative VTC domain, Protein of unknown function DUF202 protein [Trachipleistophora hominis]|uniref:Vacuolar transporter chaperone 4 n=1 Tax=Trachipleistophora hominis TaxID=72359 RepID=L7JWM5_TRAHO|nr:putative VTC domain, Protein of unknown function DUF202 protein [Trachipleistophora hominis]